MIDTQFNELFLNTVNNYGRIKHFLEIFH